MSDIDVIDRDDVVVVIDSDGETYKITKNDDILQYDETIPDDMYNIAVSETEYYHFAPNDAFDWPLEIKTHNHLEGTVGRKLLRAIDDEIGHPASQQYFESKFGGRADIPSIETHAIWSVSEDGDITLDHFKYNGVKYTPEE